MAVPKLILSNFSQRRVRVALTVAAIALSVSLVVAVTSGYTSAQAALQQWVTTYLGTNNIQISPKGNPQQVISETLIDDLRDNRVKAIAGRLETEISFLNQQGESWHGPPASVIGVRRPQDTQVEAMQIHAGAWFDSAHTHEAVIDQVLAEKLTAGIGDSITLVRNDRKLICKIVGIVHKPRLLASYLQTIYLPLETLQNFVDRPGQVSRILIDLNTGADEDSFANRAQEKIAHITPALRIRRAGERRQEMEKHLLGVQFLSYLGGTVSMLSAAFIIFATLSMGVAERTRTLAMLRAIGATKWQVASVVIYEGLILSVWGIILGSLLGVAWTHILAALHNTIFSAGVVISRGGLLFGLLGTLVFAILASLMPAWNATRVDPLEAMAPQSHPPRPRLHWLAAAIGLLLISLDPIVAFADWVPRDAVTLGHFALGLPGIFLGFFLLAPACVYTVEKILARPVASLFRVNTTLLRQQLSGAVWRASGTAAALMVGLAILVVMQTQGRSALAGWRLPTNFPDIFIWAPGGLNFEHVRMLDDVEGVRQGQVLPITIASPEFGTGIWALGAAAVLPEATMFFGIDPDRALTMLELEYRDGNAQDAMAKLKQGGHLIVTDEFRQLKGMRVGSKLSLKTTKRGLVEYTVAAVVWSPGLDVLVSWSDMGRQFDQRTAASVFGSIEDARRDFGIDRVHLFAANLEYGVDKKDIATRIEDTTTRPTSQPDAESSIFSIRAVLGKKGLQVGDIRHIKHQMVQQFTRLLMLLSTVALAAIAVASLGVTNTIMASVRSRQWQFGILRSIGVTRWQLLRLILAEALLLGVVACILGLGAGFIMAIDANELGRILVGVAPDLVIPWPIILLGVAIILTVATLAAAWPAFDAARKQPLELLQWGRASS